MAPDRSSVSCLTLPGASPSLTFLPPASSSLFTTGVAKACGIGFDSSVLARVPVADTESCSRSMA
eukprot:351383-Hanusia_phi.AAC.1